MSIARLIDTAADRFGDAIAVEDRYRSLSYAELADRVHRLAQGLRDRDLSPGSPVSVLLPNSVGAIEVDLALAIAGLVRVSLNPRLRPHEWDGIRNDCQPVALIVDTAIPGADEWAWESELPTYLCVSSAPQAGAADPCSLEAIIAATAQPSLPLSAPEPNSLCALHYSSGTTGVPKGAQRTHRNRLASLHAMRRHVLEHTLDTENQPVFLHAGPIIHTSGLFVLPMIELGGKQVLLEHPRVADIVDAISDHSVTHTVLVPTVIARLLDFDDQTLAPLRRLQMLAYAGAPMPIEHIRQAFHRITPNLVQYYGMVEAIPPLTVLDIPAHHHAMTDAPQLLGSAGRPCDSARIEVRSEAGALPDDAIGELVVEGRAVSPGYHNPSGRDDLGKSLANGVLHSGDLGYRSHDGYIYLTGRSKDMIITGGYNVYPREVEDTIASIDGVADVVVVGVPDTVWGQRIVAGYTIAPGATVTSDDIIEQTRLQLTEFKRPKAAYRIEALPLTALGKVDRAKALSLLTTHIENRCAPILSE